MPPMPCPDTSTLSRASPLAVPADASFITGSMFPYNPKCDQSLSANRWRAEVQSYAEDSQAGSRLCLNLFTVPADTCFSTRRCCDTGVHSFSFSTWPQCVGSLDQITLDGVSKNAVWGDQVNGYVGRILHLGIHDAGRGNATLCMHLKGDR